MNVDYDHLSEMVNKRYREIITSNEHDAINLLRKEFGLSISEVWEILGIHDALCLADGN